MPNKSAAVRELIGTTLNNRCSICHQLVGFSYVPPSPDAICWQEAVDILTSCGRDWQTGHALDRAGRNRFCGECLMEPNPNQPAIPAFSKS